MVEENSITNLMKLMNDIIILNANLVVLIWAKRIQSKF
jgi:hypothetical protein